jgi:hypothetical protein
LDIFGKKRIESLEATVSEITRENTELRSSKESLEATVSEMTQEITELRAVRDKYQPILDVEVEARRIIIDTKKANDEAKRLKKSAQLVYADMKKKAEERNKELLYTISEQEKEIGINLQTLGVLGTRVMLVEDLDVDPKIVLQETEENLAKINAAVKSQVIPNHINYKKKVKAYSAKDPVFYTLIPSDQKNAARLGKMALDGEIRNLQSRATVANIDKSIERARKKFATINQITDAVAFVELTDEYLESQLNKLRLRHSILERNAARKAADQAEREILRKERELERENKKLIKDAEKAAKDETRAQEMLEKARAELRDSHGAQITFMQEQVRRLEQSLEEARARNERAKSMAEMTRAGHVYVISNRGSFGEDIYKIGLTRRLEPEIRVRELGDASVPFRFDTHALIWSEDAPALENELHKIFARRRVNLVNNRREFFRVSLDEIKEAIEQLGVRPDIRTVVESEEYRESERLRRIILTKSNNTLESQISRGRKLQ